MATVRAAARTARAAFAPPAAPAPRAWRPAAAAAAAAAPRRVHACAPPPAAAAAAAAAAPPPAALTTTNVTATGASLSWAPAGGDARGVAKVTYAPAGAAAAAATAGVSSLRTATGGCVRLHGLAPATTYAVRVAALGGEPLAAGRFVTAAAADAPAGAGAPAPADGEGVPAAAAAAAAAAAVPPAPLTELSRLEFRVGVIRSVAVHPDADGLYVEEVDVGEAAPRTIVSGLVAYQPAAALDGRRVIVVANLKPRVMRGIASAGMLLCASDADKGVVEPLAPPAAAAVGDLVTFEGHASAPVAPGNRASKAFDRVAPGLRTTAEGVAVYEAPGGDAPAVPFAVGGGVVVSPSGLVGTVS